MDRAGNKRLSGNRCRARPTNTNGAAMGAVNALSADGLFIGQTPAFFDLIAGLAADADAAIREG